MSLRHVKKNGRKVYRILVCICVFSLQFASVPSPFRLHLLISFCCPGKVEDSSETSICDGCYYPEQTLLPRGEEERMPGWCPAPRSSQACVDGNADMQQCMVVSMYCFSFVCKDVSPLAEHRGVQAALIVPTPSPGSFLLLQDAPVLRWCASILSGFKLFPTLGCLQTKCQHLILLSPLRANPPPFAE